MNPADDKSDDVPRSAPIHVAQRIHEIEVELALLEREEVDPLESVAWIAYGFILLFVVRAGMALIAPGNIGLLLFTYAVLAFLGWQLTSRKYSSRRRGRRRLLERELEALLREGRVIESLSNEPTQ